MADAEAAVDREDWDAVRSCARRILAFDPENKDALDLVAAAGRAFATTRLGLTLDGQSSPAAAVPESFASGRYKVQRALGEGGKKKVYLAHDTRLDRDVAFALIKTEGLDAEGRERIAREAQAMGKLGTHPNIVSVFDLGEEAGQPYLVTELMQGGDIEGLLEKAEDHRLPIRHAVELAQQVCNGLDFAHTHGLVHRDLKPGNVWLTADGTAKIGDFGLAVSLDRTRLTTAGMMVGTVAYMPPEQATGGEISQRSDLYSLGAMLYEMVCGRPPFLGDETVAIIGQHLNTPPVAPTWHRSDCPPSLEALVLRLLEKDPQKRPESAAQVLQALEASRISSLPPAGESQREGAGSPVSPAAADNPLYRRTFVGREQELKQVHAAFDAALSGRGGLVMVVGEPGIGKTSLTEQLATYVALRGGKALVGHSYEEGSLSLPYLPFVEAMRSYVLTREPEGLKDDLGSGAVEVARIVSEVRDRVPVELRPSGDPEEERWRLLQAVTGFLRNASAVQPLLLVLEDLHDADRGTLDLLVHLSRNLDGARLLIAGTYRDVEVDRSHPLSSTLADLRRSREFLRVPLRGLTAEEVQRMMASVAQREVPWAFAELLHRQTEGNPLFVQEMLRYLVEEGLVSEQQGALRRVGDESLAGRIPEGLRDVIGKRLSRLSDKTNQVLSVAAVIGREFRLDVLQTVAGLTDDEMDTALEQAQDRAIVEQRSTLGTLVFRFTHAFFRQTLYEEIFASRRLRLHQQVARALEQVYGLRVEDHAAELAEHFAQSTDPADLGKALQYSELAARRSMQVFAYGEAARQLDGALKVQEVLDPDGASKRCDLLIATAEALLPAEEPGRVPEGVALDAFVLAQKLGDGVRAAQAALLAIEALFRLRGGGSEPATHADFREWVARLDMYAAPGSVARVYADVYAGMATIPENRSEGHKLLRRASDLATEMADERAFYAAAGWVMRFLLAAQDRERVEVLVDGIIGRPHVGVRPTDLAICYRAAGDVLLERGDRAGAVKLWDSLAVLASANRDATITRWAKEPSALFAFIDGRLQDAVDIGHELQDQSPSTPGEHYRLARSLLYLKGSEAALAVNLTGLMGMGRPQRAALACWMAHLGRKDEARALIHEFGDVSSDSDESATVLLYFLLEAALLLQDKDLARGLARRLSPFAGFSCARYVCSSYGRLLGGAAALLGEPKQARTYYTQTIVACQKIGFRPEIALVRLELAELLLDRYPNEKQAALEHLDFSIAEFREMNMQPSLERALKHKGLLHA